MKTCKTLNLFLLAVVIAAIGSTSAIADPQTLPFSFSVPELGVLNWQSIEAEGTSTPFSGECYNQIDQGINISDATSSAGIGDAYDQAWMVAVDGTAVGTGGVGDLIGNTYRTVPVIIADLQIRYELYFSNQVQCNRLLLTFDNNTEAPISESVQISTNFGSDSNTIFQATSSGNPVFSTLDRWTITTDNSNPFSDPINTTVFYGTGNPESVPFFATDQVCSAATTDGVGVEYPLTVPAGESRCLMLFACLDSITNQGASLDDAIAGANLFNSLSTIPPDLLSGLGPQGITECANWDGIIAEPIPTISEWGLIAMAAILGILGFMVIRRHQITG